MLCPQEAAERLLAAVTRTVFSMTNQGLIGGRLLEIRTCGGAVRNAGCTHSSQIIARPHQPCWGDWEMETTIRLSRRKRAVCQLGRGAAVCRLNCSSGRCCLPAVASGRCCLPAVVQGGAVCRLSCSSGRCCLPAVVRGGVVCRLSCSYASMAQILGKKSIAVSVNDTCITSSSTIDRHCASIDFIDRNCSSIDFIDRNCSSIDFIDRC